MKNNKLIWIFVGILLFAMLIRLPNINFVFSGDEGAWPQWIKYQDKHEFSFQFEDQIDGKMKYWEDLPLIGIIYSLGYKIFGYGTANMRIINYLFGIANLLLVYFLAKKIFDKKTALYALFLMTVSYWHLFVSYMIERDGSFVSFLFLSSIYAYINYRDSLKKQWLVLAGALAAISLSIRSTAIFIAAVLIVMIIYDNKLLAMFNKIRLKRVLAEAAIIIGCIAAFAFVIFISYLLNKEFIGGAIAADAAPSGIISFNLLFAGMRELTYLLLWGSPLLIGLFIASFLRYDRRNFAFLAVILFAVLGYLPAARAAAIDRYLSVIIAPLCIIGASFLASVNFNKKDLKIAGIAAVVFGVFFFILNSLKVNYIAHNLNTYLIKAVKLQWNFLFPYYGVGGPNFMMSFMTIGFALVISFVLLAAAMFHIKNTKKFKLILSLFIGAALAFNIVLIEEFNFHTNYPDISRITYDAIEEYEKLGINGPLYINQAGILLYVNKTGDDLIFMKWGNDKNATEMDKTVHEKGGAVLLIDFPKIPENSERLKLARKCNLVYTGSGKGMKIAYIYDCNNLLETENRN